LRHRDLYLFLQILLISVLAKGACFLPGYSIDDYYLVQLNEPSNAMLNQGRFGEAFVVQLFDALGLEPAYARVFFVALGLATWALLAVLVVRWWNIGRYRWLAVTAGSLIALHPFTTEIFTFRIALGSCNLALALSTLLLLPRRWTVGRIVLGSALFALALSIYQVVLHFTVMVVLMGGAIWLARALVAGQALGWSRRWSALFTWRRLLRHRQAALSFCVAAGTALYLAGTLAMKVVFHVHLLKRTQLIQVEGLRQRMADVLDLLEKRLLLPDPLIPQLTQRLLLAILVFAILGLLLRRGVWTRPRAAAAAWGSIVLIGLGLLWSIGLLLVLREFWPVARVMSHVGIFWAGVLAVAWILSGRLRHAGLALIATLVVLSFIGADNHILEDQLRINRRDILTANRIVARLEALPGFHEVEALAIDGGSWRFPVGIPTQDHDMNISAFGSKWSKVQVLREVSGYGWTWGRENELNPNPSPSPELEKAAADYCGRAEPWPAPTSVVQQGRLAIVCLPPDR
jgi:hypothetical protein